MSIQKQHKNMAINGSSDQQSSWARTRQWYSLILPCRGMWIALLGVE
jgi:hypothetical protein